MKRIARGFTLIELLVVVAIIALLISILLPSLSAARESGKRAVCASNLRSIVQAMIAYSMDNRDVMPQHEGVEPSYVYVNKGSVQWHLAELILPYMGTQNITRSGPNGTFAPIDFELSAPLGKIFHCPSTGNATRNSAASWQNPSQWGSFMDYAQIWNFVGPSAIVSGDKVEAATADGLYRVFDDDQLTIIPDTSNPYRLFRLPYSVSRPIMQLPKSDGQSRVPVIQDYLVSVGKTAAQLPGDFDAGRLRPTAGNHRWTGRANGSDTGLLKGGNFGYDDGSVQWRTLSVLRPRLMIDRTFQGGSTRPTYWW